VRARHGALQAGVVPGIVCVTKAKGEGHGDLYQEDLGVQFFSEKKKDGGSLWIFSFLLSFCLCG
jgi:hypothetical protein